MDGILIFVYYSGKTGNLVPIVSEQYGSSKVRYYAVAAVKRANRDVNITTLKGKKSCHTGTRPRNAGWNIPIGFLLSSKIIPEVACGNMNHDLISAGKFFDQSCVPGKCYRPPPGGGREDSRKFYTSRQRPSFQPLSLSYTIFTEKVPLRYIPSIYKRYAFHIPSFKHGISLTRRFSCLCHIHKVRLLDLSTLLYTLTITSNKQRLRSAGDNDLR